MGGFGSGRQPEYETTEANRALDVRVLHRAGALVPGRGCAVRWTRAGRTLATVSLRSYVGGIEVTLARATGMPRSGMEGIALRLLTSSCHYGGVRHWFQCPRCGQRVAIVYMQRSGAFGCRECLELVYLTCRESPQQRAARRASRIRERLGWHVSEGFASPAGRPRGMHLTTYESLRARHASAALAWLCKS